MKSMIVLALSLFCLNSFAQYYPPGTKGNPSRPQPRIEQLVLQPGASIIVGNTQVACADDNDRCRIERTGYNDSGYRVTQSGRPLTNSTPFLSTALDDLKALRSAGVCH